MSHSYWHRGIRVIVLRSNVFSGCFSLKRRVNSSSVMGSRRSLYSSRTRWVSSGPACRWTPRRSGFAGISPDSSASSFHRLKLESATPRRIAISLSDSSERKSLRIDRKSTRLNSSHGYISYAVFCLKKKKQYTIHDIAQHLLHIV